jgi:hypothetical protein
VAGRSGPSRANEGECRLSEDVSGPTVSGNRAASGESQSEEQQRVILEIASRALESGERDPDEVLHVAKKISLRAHLVDNLRAYASRSLFRVKRKPQVDAVQLRDVQHNAALTDSSQIEQIEAQILIQELLARLDRTDREIFVRRMNGETCPEIDEAMNLKPRTADTRTTICKNALRRAVKKKLKP